MWAPGPRLFDISPLVLQISRARFCHHVMKRLRPKSSLLRRRVMLTTRRSCTNRWDGRGLVLLVYFEHLRASNWSSKRHSKRETRCIRSWPRNFNTACGLTCLKMNRKIWVSANIAPGNARTQRPDKQLQGFLNSLGGDSDHYICICRFPWI